MNNVVVYLPDRIEWNITVCDIRHSAIHSNLQLHYRHQRLCCVALMAEPGIHTIFKQSLFTCLLCVPRFVDFFIISFHLISLPSSSSLSSHVTLKSFPFILQITWKKTTCEVSPLARQQYTRIRLFHVALSWVECVSYLLWKAKYLFIIYLHTF